MTWQPELDELQQRERMAQEMGGAEKVAKHHSQGRLTVRERIEALLDPGTFHEIGALAGSAEYSEGQLTSFRPANFVAGTGRLDGRKVVVGGDDFTVRGGAADASVVGKQIYAEQLANSLRIPIVRLIDGTGGGGSVKLLEQHGHTYVPANPAWDFVVDNLSLVPVAAACLGSVAGLGAARLVASHFSVMVEGTSQLFVAGPPVVKSGVGEDLTKEELGGAQVHRNSSAVDVIVKTEHEAFTQIHRFLSYLPQNVFQLPPVLSCQDAVDRREESLLTVIPRNRRQPYRIRPILASLFDA
ncbi:MAG: carboxyl transferase domain-containing protein, partial [Ktedonobacteraceae bacterium]